MRYKEKIAVVIISSFLLFETFGGPQKSYEFINQSIEEIVYALSLYEKITIVCDDTVDGNASFRYAGYDFNQAFDSFLSSARLYVTKEKDQWIVSKIRVFCDDEGNIQLDCYDALPSAVLEKVSEKCGVTIVYDLIPSIPISLHVSNTPVKEAVSLVLSGSDRYEIQDDANHIKITKNNEYVITPGLEKSQCSIEPVKNMSGLFNAEIINTKVTVVIEELCGLVERDVIQTGKNETLIGKIILKEKTFAELLSVICLQGNSTWIEEKNVYYIIPSPQSSVTINSIGKVWQQYSMKYKKIDELQGILQQRFPGASYIRLDGLSLIVFGSEVLHKELSDFIQGFDIPEVTNLISLQYIRSSDFLKNIPPSFRIEEFKETGDESTLFYTGSIEKYRLLCNQLQSIDIPVKRIRYDLLIIQYQKSQNISWAPSLKVRPVQSGDAFVMSVELDSVFDLQFNIISSFGLNFAAGLNLAINENKAKIFADTILHGVSGSPIKFQNTSTYRYRDTEVDSNTGKPVNTGITREIISGLILDVVGWVSGDGMVTTTVTASVSKRGADVSSNIGNPPPTYEKIITTQVRSRSGEPVILSGLIQDDDVIIQENIPLLSMIPVIGNIFKSASKTKEHTEMVIYLIPHVETETEKLVNTAHGLLGKKETEKRNGKIYARFISEGETNE